jgi:hypothetical protein
MAEELLEKIPAEKCWAITAKALTGFNLLRIVLIRALMGKGDGVFAPVMGWEKYEEISMKTWGESGKCFTPFVKETFNIPVEDAIGAAKLYIITCFLTAGPEDRYEMAEETPERAIIQWIRCGWMERYKEFEVDPALSTCPTGHQALASEGLKAINPKLTFKLTKAMPRGDPYCEGIIKFNKE